MATCVSLFQWVADIAWESNVQWSSMICCGQQWPSMVMIIKYEGVGPYQIRIEKSRCIMLCCAPCTLNGTLREDCTKFTTESSDLTKPSVASTIYNLSFLRICTSGCTFLSLIRLGSGPIWSMKTRSWYTRYSSDWVGRKFFKVCYWLYTLFLRFHLLSLYHVYRTYPARACLWFVASRVFEFRERDNGYWNISFERWLRFLKFFVLHFCISLDIDQKSSENMKSVRVYSRWKIHKLIARSLPCHRILSHEPKDERARALTRSTCIQPILLEHERRRSRDHFHCLEFLTAQFRLHGNIYDGSPSGDLSL